MRSNIPGPPMRKLLSMPTRGLSGRSPNPKQQGAKVMRILYLNPIGAIGGAERVLLSVLAAVRHSSPSVQLHLITCTEGPLVKRAEQLGVRTTLLPLPA